MKEFQEWHNLKSKINEEHIAPLFREQEMWWCSVGANIGVEADGKNEFFERPIVVLRKFNRDMFWGLPATLQDRTGSFFYKFPFLGKDQTIVLSQIRTWSSKRLIRRMGKMSDEQFALLKIAVAEVLNASGSLAGASSA